MRDWKTCVGVGVLAMLGCASLYCYPLVRGQDFGRSHTVLVVMLGSVLLVRLLGGFTAVTAYVVAASIAGVAGACASFWLPLTAPLTGFAMLILGGLAGGFVAGRRRVR